VFAIGGFILVGSWFFLKIVLKLAVKLGNMFIKQEAAK
jgi:hypothetical protein